MVTLHHVALMIQEALRLVSFRPETALFRNLFVNLRNFLCDVPRYVSAQFLDLAKNCSFLALILANVHRGFLDGHQLIEYGHFPLQFPFSTKAK